MQGEDKNVASYHFRVAVKGHSIFLETHPSPRQKFSRGKLPREQSVTLKSLKSSFLWETVNK